jgi:hypothetical protein
MRKTLILAAGCGLFASVAFAQTPPAATGAPAAQDFVKRAVKKAWPSRRRVEPAL